MPIEFPAALVDLVARAMADADLQPERLYKTWDQMPDFIRAAYRARSWAGLGALADAGQLVQDESRGSTAAAAERRRILGIDDEPVGVLDRYDVGATTISAGRPLVYWACLRCDNGPYVGIIARDLDGSQAGLTIAELAHAALSHDEEKHHAD